MLFLAVGIFLTMMAWLLIDLYHIKQRKYIDRDIPEVQIPTYHIDTHIFPTLAQKTP